MRKSGNNILAFFFCILLSNGLRAQELADVHRMMDNERYAAAEELLEKKIRAEGAAPELNYLLIKSYLGQDKTDAAQQFIEEQQLHLTQDGADPVNQIAYGRYLLETGEAEKARAVFNAILETKKNRKDSRVLIPMAEAYIKADKADIKQALEWLDMAADKDKKNLQIGILRGQAYRKLGNGSAAYEAYQEVLKKDPGHIEGNYLMGKLFRAQNNPEIYMRYFEKVYAADSTFAPVLDELYDHYYYRDSRLAKKFLQKYIGNTDYSVKNEYRMTDLFYLNREYPEAIRSALSLLQKEGDQPTVRLYKLIAYAYAGTGDSLQADRYMDEYLSKAGTANIIAPDYELKARLTARKTGQELQAIEYYNKAFSLDSLGENKLGYARKIAGLYQLVRDYSNEAKWLKLVYDMKEDKTNLDLYYWGVAHYNAGEYADADSVFSIYTGKYPENLYGYYWRAQANAAIDTSFAEGLAVPHYEKLVELGEKDPVANKTMLAKAFGYLGAYEANATKNYERSLMWFEKFLAIDPGNEDAVRYSATLRQWMADPDK